MFSRSSHLLNRRHLSTIKQSFKYFSVTISKNVPSKKASKDCMPHFIRFAQKTANSSYDNVQFVVSTIKQEKVRPELNGNLYMLPNATHIPNFTHCSKRLNRDDSLFMFSDSWLPLDIKKWSG